MGESNTPAPRRSLNEYCLLMTFGYVNGDPTEMGCGCGVSSISCPHVNFNVYPPVNLEGVRNCGIAIKHHAVGLDAVIEPSRRVDKHCATA